VKRLVGVFFAWEGILLAGFLAGRGEDIGRLPVLLDSFGQSLAEGPVVRPAVLAETLGGALVALAIVLAWAGFGGALERALAGAWARGGVGGTCPPALAFARRCAFGAGVTSLFWFWLGLAGVYRGWAAVALLLAGLALGGAVRARRAPGPPRPRARDRSALLAWACLLAPLVLAGVGALAPPTGKDALIYHLALPRIFVERGGLVEIPDNVPGYYPLGVEMQAVWGLLAGGVVSARVGETAATAVVFAFFPVLVASVFGWARAVGVERGWSLCAAALVASAPTAFAVASSGYVDLALAVYATLALEAAARWWAAPGRLALAHLALAVGFALATKLLGLFVLVPLPLLVLLRARRAVAAGGAARPLVAGGAAALLAAALVAGPWYVRTWVLTGSPLFPFYLDLWPASAPGWDARRSALFHAFLAQYGGDAQSALDYLLAPVRVSLLAQPEVAGRYDGVLGVTFLVALPVLLGRAPRAVGRAEVGVAAALAALLVAQWIVSSQQVRFLLPALPALAVVIAAAASPLAVERPLRWGLLGAAAVGLLVTVAWFLAADPLRVALGGEPRETYLTRRLDHYAYYRLVNGTLPEDARIWLIATRRDTYHLRRAYVADYQFEDHTLRAWVAEARDAADVRARARRAGITHVFARHDVLFDPRTAPFDDPERMRIVRAFLAEGTRVLRIDARFVLVELPPDAAAPRRTP
jgi:hypothetical protein